MIKTVVAKRNGNVYRGYNQQGTVSFGGRTTAFFRALSRSLNTWNKMEYRDGRSGFVPTFG